MSLSPPTLGDLGEVPGAPLLFMLNGMSHEGKPRKLVDKFSKIIVGGGGGKLFPQHP